MIAFGFVQPTLQPSQETGVVDHHGFTTAVADQAEGFQRTRQVRLRVVQLALLHADVGEQ